MNILRKFIQWLESLGKKAVPVAQAETTTTEEETMSVPAETVAAATDAAATTEAAAVATDTSTVTESWSAEELAKIKKVLVSLGHDVEAVFDDAVALVKKA